MRHMKMHINFFFFHRSFPLEYIFTYRIFLMQWENKFKKISTRVNQKKIKPRERGLYLDQWKTFSGKYQPIKSYGMFTKLPPIFHFSSGSLKLKNVSYFPWKNKYSNQKTTGHIKPKFLLWTKLRTYLN